MLDPLKTVKTNLITPKQTNKIAHTNLEKSSTYGLPADLLNRPKEAD